MSDILKSKFEEELVKVYGDFIKATDTEYRINCPFCEAVTGSKDTKHHMYVNPFVRTTNGKEGAFNCFRCESRSWDLQKLNLSRVSSSNLTKNELIQSFDYDIDTSNIFSEIILGKLKNGNEEINYLKEIDLPAEYTRDFNYCSLGKSALSYLKSRNLSDETIEYSKVGYCRTGEFRNSIIFPVYEDGKLVYFVSRHMFYKRYKNASVSKKYIIYNADALQKEDYVVLAEGIFDALSFGSNGIALLGKSLSKYQASKIINGNQDAVFICLDNDARKSATDIARKLQGYGGSVYLVSLPDGRKDANECSKEEIKSMLTNAVYADAKGIVEFSLFC